MRGLLRLLFWLILFGAEAAGAVTGWRLYRDMVGPGPLAQARSVVIPADTGVSGVASRLAKEGVVRSPLGFVLAAIVSGRRAKLKAGEYRFPPHTSALAAAALLASGKTVVHRLTIPEGLSCAEILALVRAAPALAGRTGQCPGEGKLMPSTYFYSYGERRRTLLDRMRRGMAQTVAKVWAARRVEPQIKTRRQLVTLASIIEKETARPDERGRIAAVFLNRLKSGMPLQSDPTVIYALSENGQKPFARTLTKADLATKSPYNTYVVKGLPPGPIDSPGLASLVAAAHPDHTSDLYFVANGKGGHRFARTLAQQNRNVLEYRQKEAADPPPAQHASAAP